MSGTGSRRKTGPCSHGSPLPRRSSHSPGRRLGRPGHHSSSRAMGAQRSIAWMLAKLTCFIFIFFAMPALFSMSLLRMNYGHYVIISGSRNERLISSFGGLRVLFVHSKASCDVELLRGTPNWTWGSGWATDNAAWGDVFEDTIRYTCKILRQTWVHCGWCVVYSRHREMIEFGIGYFRTFHYLIVLLATNGSWSTVG